MAKPALTPSDFIDDAKALGVEVIDIMTVFNVESKGYGYDSTDFPKTLFEGHKFHAATGGKFDQIAPDLSYPVWTKKFYRDEKGERERLARAIALDRNAALESASWGAPQIMGFNWKDCGCSSIQDFVNKMILSSDSQLALFTKLILSWGLQGALKAHNWEAFAKRYNGTGQVAEYARLMRLEYTRLNRK